MSRALTVEQASEFLQVSPYTVRKWLREGRIPGTKIGRVYRILDSDLEMLVGAEVQQAAGVVREKVAEMQYKASESEPGEEREPAGLSSPGHSSRRKISALSLVGKYRRVGRTVEDFMREKAAEVEEEERRWEEKHRR